MFLTVITHFEKSLCTICIRGKSWSPNFGWGDRSKQYEVIECLENACCFSTFVRLSSIWTRSRSFSAPTPRKIQVGFSVNSRGNSNRLLHQLQGNSRFQAPTPTKTLNWSGDPSSYNPSPPFPPIMSPVHPGLSSHSPFWLTELTTDLAP